MPAGSFNKISSAPTALVGCITIANVLLTLGIHHEVTQRTSTGPRRLCAMIANTARGSCASLLTRSWLIAPACLHYRAGKCSR